MLDFISTKNTFNQNECKGNSKKFNVLLRKTFSLETLFLDCNRRNDSLNQEWNGIETFVNHEMQITRYLCVLEILMKLVAHEMIQEDFRTSYKSFKTKLSNTKQLSMSLYTNVSR